MHADGNGANGHGTGGSGQGNGANGHGTGGSGQGNGANGHKPEPAWLQKLKAGSFED
jgi:hypothetical protein